MSEATARTVSASGNPEEATSGVLRRDGVYYASLKIQGEEAPLVIALHGVATEQEARQARATLARLYSIEWQPVPE